MTRVVAFEDMDFTEVKSKVEHFLDAAKAIQIINISWVKTKLFWVCIITYFEVE